MAQLHQDGSRGARLVATSLVALAFALAACGGDDSGAQAGAATSAGTSSTSTASDGSLAATEKKLEVLYAGATFKEPATDGPAPKPNKNVWVVDLDLSTDPVRFANGAKEAAKDLGWKVTAFDGKFQPSRFLEGIQQATAAKADAIVIYAIDCPIVKAALQQAHDAGIVVVDAESQDCKDTPLFDGSVSFTMGEYPEWVKSAGQANADWTIVNAKGKAKVINFVQTDIPALLIFNQGFTDELGTCGGCEIVDTVKFTAADLGPKLQEKAAQALLKNRDANAINVPYDGANLAGVAPAIVASGRNDDLLVVAGGGTAAGTDLIRANGGEDAGYSTSLEWEGWAAIDALNRLFNDEKPKTSGIGMQVFDRDHNMPKSGPWQPPVDYKAAYRKAWGTTP
jgi:ribose transport system substrate-binding protein